MTNYNEIASSKIREYIWEQIKNNAILDPNNYKTDVFTDLLVPIIPAQQVPEFNNLLPGKSYIIYDFETKAIPSQWWMTEETMNIFIISQKYDKINQISNFMTDIFRRYDDSASDINAYFKGSVPFNFHYTSIDSVLSPEPFGSEGDYQIGGVTITYSYSREIGSTGRF